MSIIRSYKVYENANGNLHVLIEQDGRKMLFDGWEELLEREIERNLAEWYIDSQIAYRTENLVVAVEDGEQIGEAIADVVLNSCLCLEYVEIEDNDGHYWKQCAYVDKMGIACKKALGIRQ